jgi:hypothetical protein
VVTLLKSVNVVDQGKSGNVEKWLDEFENEMRNTI